LCLRLRSTFSQGEFLTLLARKLFGLSTFAPFLFFSALLSCLLPLLLSLGGLLLAPLALPLAKAQLLRILTGQTRNIALQLDGACFSILDAARNHGMQRLEVGRLRTRWQTFIICFVAARCFHLCWPTHPIAATHVIMDKLLATQRLPLATRLFRRCLVARLRGRRLIGTLQPALAARLFLRATRLRGRRLIGTLQPALAARLFWGCWLAWLRRWRLVIEIICSRVSHARMAAAIA